MAYMITDGANSMTAIKNFLGLNLSETGETNLKLRRSFQDEEL